MKTLWEMSGEDIRRAGALSSGADTVKDRGALLWGSGAVSVLQSLDIEHPVAPSASAGSSVLGRTFGALGSVGAALAAGVAKAPSAVGSSVGGGVGSVLSSMFGGMGFSFRRVVVVLGLVLVGVVVVGSVFARSYGAAMGGAGGRRR